MSGQTTMPVCLDLLGIWFVNYKFLFDFDKINNILPQLKNVNQKPEMDCRLVANFSKLIYFDGLFYQSQYDNISSD